MTEVYIRPHKPGHGQFISPLASFRRTPVGAPRAKPSAVPIPEAQA